MKRIFAVVMAVAFVFSVAGFAVAADNAMKAAPAKKEAAPMAEKKAAPTAEKKAAKPKAVQVTGTIEALDAAAGTFTVKGKKGNVDLKAGEKVKLGDFKVGDKVVVKYADGSASSVKAVKAAKAKKAEPKAEAKPVVEKKAAPAPAAAPLPASGSCSSSGRRSNPFLPGSGPAPQGLSMDPRAGGYNPPASFFQ